MTKNKTASTADFSAQYKDPRWQKKRLEVLEHDQFTCQRCKSTDKQLHVHHTQYTKGYRAWDYPVCALITLCDDCHSSVHKMKEDISNVWEFFESYRRGSGSTYDDLFAVHRILLEHGTGYDAIKAIVELCKYHYECVDEV